MERVELFRRIEQARPRFFTRDELAEICDSMDRKEDAAILWFLANTGLRWGELQHLEWSDVDLNNRMITIRPKHGWSPKTGIERDIPLNDVAYQTLAKRPRTRGYVFTSGSRHMLHNHHVRERLYKTCEELGIENVNLHTFRHTFCSHLVMAGVDLPTVAKLAGHTDIKTTMIYSHLAAGHVRQAVGRIGLG